MSRWMKWLVVPVVLVGALLWAGTRQAQAGPWGVHIGWGWGHHHHHHVYHPGHYHYVPGHFHYSPWGSYYYPSYYRYHPGHWHTFCD